MNLHNIVSENLELILDYMPVRFGWVWRIHPDEPGALQYDPSEQGGWQTLNARDTLTYTNEALRWSRQGRPDLR